jgi:hypothetical protein
MLVRETSAAFVLALVVATFLSGRRRESLIVALLAFAPLALWRAFVGVVFLREFGIQAFTFHPDNFDVPLRGVRELWMKIAHNTYYEGNPEMARAGWTFPFVVAGGVALSVMLAISQRSPIALAGLVYAAMAAAMNYRGVWLHVGNAERVSMDMFLAIALTSAALPRGSRILVRATTAFWFVTAFYLVFLTYFAVDVKSALLPWS